jgi:hypothetical protein
MTVSFLQESLGGKLTHTVVDLGATGGRWDSTTAPTATFHGKGGGIIVSTRTCDLGPSTTLGAAAAASQKSLTIATTTDLVRWNNYVVGPNISGQWEWVTIDAIATTAVSVVDDLQYAYSSGDTFKSHDMSVTFTSADITSIYRDCYAAWSYNVDGISRKDHTLFHVSLYAPRLSLSAADVVQEYPRAHQIISSQQKIGLLIKNIWESRLLPDLGRIVSPGALVSGETANEALLYRVVRHIMLQSRDFDGAELYDDMYKDAIDRLRSGLIDPDESGGVGDDETVRGVRTPRVRRG